jgi:hypothetical protein
MRLQFLIYGDLSWVWGVSGRLGWRRTRSGNRSYQGSWRKQLRKIDWRQRKVAFVSGFSNKLWLEESTSFHQRSFCFLEQHTFTEHASFFVHSKCFRTFSLLDMFLIFSKSTRFQAMLNAPTRMLINLRTRWIFQRLSAARSCVAFDSMLDKRKFLGRFKNELRFA